MAEDDAAVGGDGGGDDIRQLTDSFEMHRGDDDSDDDELN